jgi:hypothetical protein
MNCVYIKIMLKVGSLKTELLKVSPSVPCGVVCVGVCLVTDCAFVGVINIEL